MKYRSVLWSASSRKFLAIPVVGLAGTVLCAHGQTLDVPPLSNDSASAETRGTSGRAFSIVPRISVGEVATDNVRLQSTGKQSDLVTTISPGVLISSDTGRLKGRLDYSLSQNLYARDSSQNTMQNALDSFAKFEAISNFAYVDFSGVISQQSISAFGQQSDNNAVLNSNRTEVSSFRVSPYIRGRFGDFANYQARYGKSISRSKSDLASNIDADELSASLSGESGLRVLSWSADVSRQKQEYSKGTETEADRLRGVLTYRVLPQLTMSAIGGKESNNYASPEKESHNTYGAGMDWALSERTRFSAQIENRFFGRSHNLTFEHRTARTAWRFSDVKDVSVMPNTLATSNLGPLYDLIFSQFASVEPDPIRRAQLVQSFLQANGLNGATNVNIGFLASGVTLQRRQDLSFTLLGLRDTLTLIASQGITSRLTEVPATSDDLANSSLIRQRGFSVSYSHRLTQESSFNLLVSQLRSIGDLSSQSSNLRSLNLSVSTRLGLKTTATLGARHSIFDGFGAYKESAVLGTLTVQF